MSPVDGVVHGAVLTFVVHFDIVRIVLLVPGGIHMPIVWRVGLEGLSAVGT